MALYEVQEDGTLRKVAGNGISINSKKLYSHSFINSSTSIRTATPSSGIVEVVTIQVNKVEESSKLLINWSCPITNNSEGYGSFITIKLDGSEIGERVIANMTSFYGQNIVLNNVSAGLHTFNFCIGNGGKGSTSISAYDRPTGTIVEVL